MWMLPKEIEENIQFVISEIWSKNETGSWSDCENVKRLFKECGPWTDVVPGGNESQLTHKWA